MAVLPPIPISFFRDSCELRYCTMKSFFREEAALAVGEFSVLCCLLCLLWLL